MSEISDKPDVAPSIVDGRGELVEVRRFERRLAHPPEKVWRALTDTSELAHWFPASVEGKREKGASLSFAFHDGEEKGVSGTVTQCDPPRVLAYTMGDEALRWELTPLANEGCLLVFTTETRLRHASANDNGTTKCLAA